MLKFTRIKQKFRPSLSTIIATHICRTGLFMGFFFISTHSLHAENQANSISLYITKGTTTNGTEHIYKTPQKSATHITPKIYILNNTRLSNKKHFASSVLFINITTNSKEFTNQNTDIKYALDKKSKEDTHSKNKKTQINSLPFSGHSPYKTLVSAAPAVCASVYSSKSFKKGFAGTNAKPDFIFFQNNPQRTPFFYTSSNIAYSLAIAFQNRPPPFLA